MRFPEVAVTHLPALMWQCTVSVSTVMLLNHLLEMFSGPAAPEASFLRRWRLVIQYQLTVPSLYKPRHAGYLSAPMGRRGLQ